MTDKPITIPAIRIPALRDGRMTQMVSGKLLSLMVVRRQ